MNATDTTSAYRALKHALGEHLPESRLIDDPLRTLAYGTDASFYRLIPQLVVRVESEAELQCVLAECRQRQLPVTFRAAGTSLSGQALTDSVLVQLGKAWRDAEVLDDGEAIRLEPGVIGARANTLLAPFGRKIGPDPASINSCMIGGIAANNASGMCCGTAQNSYQTVRDIRVVLPDGTLLDTADADSVAAFREQQAALLRQLETLAAETRADTALAERIRHKYRLKNTTGYALNSLVDFADGIEILKHLMIGSEGTLGFIASITYRSVVDEANKAAALVLFPDMASACRATMQLKQAPVSAVELMDYAALCSVQGKPGMPAALNDLPEGATALLVDVRGMTEDELQARLEQVKAAIADIATLTTPAFTRDSDTYAAYWKVRKGLFPAVGAVRESGTTVVIEDVAFPIERLEQGVAELSAVFQKHGYDEAILFGHALDGNLHFVFPQGFEKPGETQRYQALMDDVAQLVGVEYGGSLKAEHGTGRNMAPYVELEWGADAYQLMWRIKTLFDPDGLINPDVMLSRDATLHLKNLKPLPAADPLVDKCIECGFCESVCPSKHLSLTPRQRIVVRRELARLEALGAQQDEVAQSRLAELSEAYQYQAVDTCAADGLCATQCPVDINTGDLMRAIRHDQHQHQAGIAKQLGQHFNAVTRLARGVLRVADTGHRALGTPTMSAVTRGARRISGNRLPEWQPSMPAAAPIRVLEAPSGHSGKAGKVVYLPSCATRVFGAGDDETESRSVMEITLALLDKAGYEVVLPSSVSSLCCGMAFQSKGQFEEADRKAAEVGEALLAASENGRHPILCDTSPCTLRLGEQLSAPLQVLDPVAFAHDYLLPRLEVAPLPERIALHVTCSSTRMGLTDKFQALARACARDVVIPDGINCCGFSGDKGFTVPELNASALDGLAEQVSTCEAGYSNSRTCEIGLTQHGAIPYRSILSLLDRASQPLSLTEQKA